MNNEVTEVLDSQDYENLANYPEKQKKFIEQLKKGLKNFDFSKFEATRLKTKNKMMKIGSDPEAQKKYIHETYTKLSEILETLGTIAAESYWLESYDGFRDDLMRYTGSFYHIPHRVLETDKRLNPDLYTETESIKDFQLKRVSLLTKDEK